MMKNLPRFFTKYSTDPSRLSDILRIPRVINLDLYLEMRMLTVRCPSSGLVQCLRCYTGIRSALGPHFQALRQTQRPYCPCSINLSHSKSPGLCFSQRGEQQQIWCFCV